MPASAEWTIFDTTVYIEAARRGPDSPAHLALELEVSRTYLASVVCAELRAGVRDEQGARAVAALTDPFYRVDRVVTPDADSWRRAGGALAAIARQEPALRDRVARLWNDVLIACSARQIGARVVTGNVDDFRLLQRHVSFALEPFVP